jgi:hypothetical protein
MGVVHVGHMGMRMPDGHMAVPVAVFPHGHGVVQVVVMPVVVPVGVLMLQRIVFVLVVMGLS